ncbi:MAG: hypothetical protein A4E63_00003 [Syntrophorhabdus sp. PtaU1.Bin050]|nr:MAG: hypothetical protein A4E63_00003 [Syntrophorhabdus sp. PtaU1.Bin050]
MIPLRFQSANTIPAITGTHVVPSTSKAAGATPSRPRTGYVCHERFIPGLTSRHPLSWVPGQQSCRSLPYLQADMNLHRNRIPSTIPFPRQASDLTRHYVPLRSMLHTNSHSFIQLCCLRRHLLDVLKCTPPSPPPCRLALSLNANWYTCENSVVCRYSVVLRKNRWNYTVSPRSPFACAGGTPGTTHSHVTGPQVVPQCSLQEQPSVHAIRIFHEFSSTRERVIQGLQIYAVLKESYSYMLESAISTNKFLQKNIFTHFFFPDSHNRRGESGLSGKRHGRNVSDVDEMRVLADRRRTERTLEGAWRSRSPQMDISIMPLTNQEKKLKILKKYNSLKKTFSNTCTPGRKRP